MTYLHNFQSSYTIGLFLDRIHRNQGPGKLEKTEKKYKQNSISTSQRAPKYCADFGFICVPKKVENVRKISSLFTARSKKFFLECPGPIQFSRISKSTWIFVSPGLFRASISQGPQECSCFRYSLVPPVPHPPPNKKSGYVWTWISTQGE